MPWYALRHLAKHAGNKVMLNVIPTWPVYWFCVVYCDIHLCSKITSSLAILEGHLGNSPWLFNQRYFPPKVWGREQFDTATTTEWYYETSPIHLLEIFAFYLIRHRDQMNIQHKCCFVTWCWTNSLCWHAWGMLVGQNVLWSLGNWQNFSFFAKAFGLIPN